MLYNVRRLPICGHTSFMDYENFFLIKIKIETKKFNKKNFFLLSLYIIIDDFLNKNFFFIIFLFSENEMKNSIIRKSFFLYIL